MSDVVSIYEAKTQLSSLVKRARDGETIYIGRHGRAEAVLAPLPRTRPIRLGILVDQAESGFDYEAADLIGPDRDLWKDFDADSPL